MARQRLSRRELLRQAAIGTGAVVAGEALVGSSAPAPVEAAPLSPTSAALPHVHASLAAADEFTEGFQALNHWQGEMVDAIASRLILTTDTPGAREAGVVFYIDKALAGYLSYANSTNLEDQRPVYRRCLQGIENYSRATFNRGYLDLTAAQQDQVLMDMQDNVEAIRPYFAGPSAAAFFNTVRSHVIEGMFSDPMYGGNRDMVGWRLIGFGGAQFGYGEQDMRVRPMRRPLTLADHFRIPHND